MECRICLTSDHPDTFLRPCRCRGTSAYIHEHCLRTYFRYYPDRLCRVCREPMEHPWIDLERNLRCAVTLFLWSSVLLGLSSMPVGIKALCLSIFGGLLVYHVKRRQLTYETTCLGLVASGILYLSDPTILPQSVLLVYSLLLLMCLCLFLSIELLFVCIVLGLALTYSTLLTLAVATKSDPAFTGLFLLAITSFWMVFLRPNGRNTLWD